jgi:hypothetical protein
VGALLLLLIIGGGLFATGVIGGSDNPTLTPAAIASGDGTNTPATAVGETEEPPPATATVNQVATQLAELSIALTQAAATDTPTTTPTASRTPTATPTSAATVDATAEFLATCVPTVRLVSASRENTTSDNVFTGGEFNAQWVLENNSDCPWQSGLLWVYVEGEAFGFEGDPIGLETAVAPGEQTTITAPFIAPTAVGTYESTWQLQDSSGEPLGEPLTFRFIIVPRQTPTPTRPPATVAPTAAPTSAVVGTATFIYEVETCEYPGDGPDWRCRVKITPYLDGTDQQIGNFTVFVFDGPQPAEYRGNGPFYHFADARRCALYIHEIRVIEDITGTEASGSIFIDPNEHFPGGCTLP